jgi:hypothetical protein
MTTRRMGPAGAALLVWAAIAAAAPAPERKPPTAEEIARAVKVVQGDEKLTGRGAVIAAIEDAAVGKTLPEYVFVSVLFRQFPVGRRPPEGLKASNVFAVDRDSKVTSLTDAKDLEKFFREHLAAAKEDDQLKEDARAWVRLAQQFRQDGFFKFSLMDDATKVSPAEGGKSVTATVVAMQGGSGTLGATLTFDEAGKLTKVAEENKLRPGPRPICQATKLLDADPLVRRMAEQDLLIVGPAARPYLDEQRAKASPELRRAIDRLWQSIVDAER